MTSSPQPFFSKDGSCAPKDSKEATLSYTESEKESVRFISTAVFNVYRLTQRLPAYHDARAIIERYFQLYLVPYKVEPKLRVRLMADLFRNLDDIGCMYVDIFRISKKNFVLKLSKIILTVKKWVFTGFFLLQKLIRINFELPKEGSFRFFYYPKKSIFHQILFISMRKKHKKTLNFILKKKRKIANI